MIPLFKVFMVPEAGLAVAAVLESGYVGEGPRVKEFELGLQRVLGLPRAPLAVNSCTSAIDLALHLCGVGPGNEVISTPMTCAATNTPIVNRGAKVVWADVDPVTGLVDPRDVARKVSTRTRAIVAVDWGGRVCDYSALKSLGVPVIQDAAHAFGSDMPERGDYTCWSFQAIKHLTTGDGGALLVPEEQATRARLLRWYGLDRESSASFRCAQDIPEAGYKYHMNDVAAAIGLANLPHAADVVRRHRENARCYDVAFKDVPGVERLPWDEGSAYWIYNVLVDDPARTIAALKERGVEASPVHRRNDSFSAMNSPSGPLPGVDRFASREIAVPVGWWLTGRDLDQVIDAVTASVAG